MRISRQEQWVFVTASDRKLFREHNMSDCSRRQDDLERSATVSTLQSTYVRRSAWRTVNILARHWSASPWRCASKSHLLKTEPWSEIPSERWRRGPLLKPRWIHVTHIKDSKGRARLLFSGTSFLCQQQRQLPHYSTVRTESAELLATRACAVHIVVVAYWYVRIDLLLRTAGPHLGNFPGCLFSINRKKNSKSL